MNVHMKYTTGEVLTAATIGLAALAAFGFYVLSVVRPEALDLTPPPMASSTAPYSSELGATTTPLSTSTIPE